MLKKVKANESTFDVGKFSGKLSNFNLLSAKYYCFSSKELITHNSQITEYPGMVIWGCRGFDTSHNHITKVEKSA